MGIFKKKKIDKRAVTYKQPSDTPARLTWKYSNTTTKLSLLIFGLGNLLHKQFVRGFIFLALEIAYIVYMVTFGVQSIGDFITLGTHTQQEVWNDAKGIYEYVIGDNSMLCLLYGVITIFLTLAIIFVAYMSLKSAFCTQMRVMAKLHVPTFKDDLRSLKEENLHSLLLAFPVVGALVFTIVPLVYMILIAFTNYDSTHQPPGNLFDWVGLANFKSLFAAGGRLAQTFWPVLGWTLIWAVCATASNFILGMLLAIIINRKGTKAKGFWRFMFVLSIAVPQFVSLLAMKTIFNVSGPVNVILKDLGLIDKSIPFFLDANTARVTIILINIWIGVPYTMLSTTGILQNIPGELYEAARIDGATAPTIFRKITLPYMIFVMTPTLITSFTGNINNFNVIYLLSGGGPATLDYYFAGKTDLLVTWLYNLTITNKDYSLGAVIGIMTFVILATVSLLTYHRTGAYKDEGAFQ